MRHRVQTHRSLITKSTFGVFRRLCVHVRAAPRVGTRVCTLKTQRPSTNSYSVSFLVLEISGVFGAASKMRGYLYGAQVAHDGECVKQQCWILERPEGGCEQRIGGQVKMPAYRFTSISRKAGRNLSFKTGDAPPGPSDQGGRTLTQNTPSLCFSALVLETLSNNDKMLPRICPKIAFSGAFGSPKILAQ